ncbi:SRPBCC family protein [Halapricum salinum]|uniref:SRPBCC family protein n=1 Tax=Halapricum salinum TaxID=1457250 RepID=A0A4D6HI47_9EURY|nr:SRPBCC family protein [Halapricum salinum]QCC52692.1 SRPBCC family protein [Halapricum salinum]
MESITLSHVVDAPPSAVRDAIADVEPFMRAAGFDEVQLDGDRLAIAKAVGLLKISLSLRILDEPDAVLTYEQAEGIFESMITRYTVTDEDDGAEVTVRTEFALDVPGGSILDATVIKRQRRKEIEGQFDYLDEALA